ncbi:MAG: hypothetical protein AAF797_00935 [Planctomycetota bacterium]
MHNKKNICPATVFLLPLCFVMFGCSTYSMDCTCQKSKNSISVDSLEAKSITIRDSDGVARVHIFNSGNSNFSGVYFSDKSGRLVRSISVFNDGSAQDLWVSKKNTAGNPSLMVDLGEEGDLNISNENNNILSIPD